VPKVVPFSLFDAIITGYPKCSGLPPKVSINLSVVEYGRVVWHHNLTTAQSDQLEALQNALYALFSPTGTTITAPVYCKIEPLKLRRHNFLQKFLKHDLLPVT